MSASDLLTPPTPEGTASDGLDLAALFARRRAGRAGTLERTRALCAAMNDPQTAFASLAVSGTNGKSSVTRMIAALLTAHGVRTGAFTSPHLADVRERIAVDGRPIDREAFASTLREILARAEPVELVRGEEASFFELLTALACRHLADRAVGAGVFEVGIGGARDATRAVDARIAVFTAIALDHPELGTTPAEVAAEKAGLVTHGATVVCARQEAGVAELIDRVVAARGGQLVREGRDVGVRARTPQAGGQWLDLAGVTDPVTDIWLPLRGAHQASNAACALAAAEVVLGTHLDAQAVRAGFAAVRAPGRLERIDRPGCATVLLDGAHNPAAARALAATLRSERRHRRCVLVLGACADKDLAGIVDALTPVVDHVVTTTAPTPRAVPAAALAQLVRERGHPVDVVSDVADALAGATRLVAGDDLVVVTGSLSLLAIARDAVRGPS